MFAGALNMTHEFLTVRSRDGRPRSASPENFDADLGRKIARKNAIDKVWPLMGYELRSKLAAA